MSNSTPALSYQDFQGLSTEAWAAQVAKDLKGKLTAEDLSQVPFSTYPDLKLPATLLADSTPSALASHIQAAMSNKKSAGWQYRELLCVDAGQEEAVANQAIACTQWGADSISIWGLAAPDYQKLLTLLGKAQIKGVRLYLEAPYDVVAKAANHHYFQHLGGAVVWVPKLDISHVGEEGYLRSYAQLLSDNAHVEVLADVSGFSEAGANLITEHAAALSIFTEWIHRLSDNGINPRDLVSRMEVHVGVSPQYLLELSGLRALRYLIGKVWEHFGVKDAEVRLWARGSQAFSTPHDPETNLLRNTVMALAIAAGGADVMSLPQHISGGEGVSAQEVEHSMRWSRNIHHLLKEESFAHLTKDAAAGSRYLDEVSARLAEAIWSTFQKWEDYGGYLRCYKHQVIQEASKADAASVSEAIKTGARIVVGANKYAPASPKPYRHYGQPIPGLPAAGFGYMI